MAKLKPETIARKQREANKKLIKRLEKQLEMMYPLVDTLGLVEQQYKGTLDLIYDDLCRRVSEARADAQKFLEETA